MKYAFKTNDEVEAKIFMNAKENYLILWKLYHNFWRRFENVSESEDYHKGIELVLDELAKEIKDFEDVEE